jgi:hypothetical protein
MIFLVGLNVCSGEHHTKVVHDAAVCSDLDKFRLWCVILHVYVLGCIWIMVTDLSQDFHGEAFGGPYYSCLKQAQVSDGPTARGKLHLGIRRFMVWYRLGSDLLYFHTQGFI